MSVIPPAYVDLLGSRTLAHIATIGPRHEPQSTPVWFGWDGKYILLTLVKTAQKYRNLRRNPQLALSIVDPENIYRYLEIRGKVIDFKEDADRRFVNSLAKKYLDLDIYPWHRPGDEHIVVIIEPEHTTSMG
ncbi:MAG TPA: PPOX class F420-dependent oxidoreductase [Ktedonobacteraceae bacterium]|nr:PPOX class F420-dependent oxidoreductase [Ktedonobacteraceae bacterium]